MQLPWLDPGKPDESFPPVASAFREPNGLLAAGGDLSVERLLQAYAHGIFPWYGPGEPILWWSPDPRCVFPLDAVHVSRSLRRRMDAAEYAVTLDRDFAGVVAACAAPRQRQRGTWLSTEMRAAYAALHGLGYAHSIEIWQEGVLAGGLYGVALGRMFFGESMFSHRTDGSKLALVHLADQLRAWRYSLIDGQVGSPHLYRMGAIDLPRRDFLDILAGSLAHPTRPGPWQLEIADLARHKHLPASG